MPNALRQVLAALPPNLVRTLGRLQFRYPQLRRLALALNTQLTEGEGVIRHGPGAGLRFNGTGGQPGYLLGTSEPEEQKLLSVYLKPGGVFYDIGANIGFFSTIAARIVRPGGSVWAFEPFPASAELARHNASLNGFDHVNVIEAAVGRESARLPLALGEGSTQHRLVVGGDGPEVEVVAIDEWRKTTKAPPPSLVLIDIEGHELEALEGMMATLSECRPVLACEVHSLGCAFLQFVEERLAPLGYSLTALAGTIPTEPERWHALLVGST